MLTKFAVEYATLVTKHDDDHLRMVRPDMTEKADTVLIGQVDIEQDDRGARCSGKPADGLSVTAGTIDGAKAGKSVQQAYKAPDDQL